MGSPGWVFSELTLAGLAFPLSESSGSSFGTTVSDEATSGAVTALLLPLRTGVSELLVVGVDGAWPVSDEIGVSGASFTSEATGSPSAELRGFRC